MKILVIGAGIGGLAAARALSTDGHDVAVFERAPALRTSGAALTLWSNGTGILDALGVSSEGLGAPVDVLEQRAFDGSTLMRIDVSRAAARYGHPHISMPRRNLIRRLAESLPADVAVTFDKSCVAVEQHPDGAHPDGAEVTFADGTKASGDLVIGADGSRSAVREHVWGSDPTRPTGWSTWQGLSAVDLDVTKGRTGLMILGREGMCGLLPAGDGLVQWWFDARRPVDDPRRESPIAVLRKEFGHWSPPIGELLYAVDDDDVEFFTHYRHKVPRVWSRGRATLIGDAAHTMPPTVAQGGNQALEDAWTLARALRRSPSDVQRALSQYEKARTRKASRTARFAGSEQTNKYMPTLSRLTPDALVSRFYTRFLRQVSTFLTIDPAER